MKREHIYRAQRTDNGKWVYGYLSFIYVDGKDENGFIYTNKAQIYSQENASNYEVHADTISQYIGQKDKTGKRIFEYDFYRQENMLYVCLYSEEIAGFCWIDELQYWTFIDDGFLHIDDGGIPYNCPIEDNKYITIASNIIDKPLKLTEIED